MNYIRDTLRQISQMAGYNPRICLRKVDDEFPDAKAVFIAVTDKDNRVHIRMSNTTLGDLAFVKCSIDAYMIDAMNGGKT